MSFATRVRFSTTILALLVAFSATAFAQIPDPGFETWTGTTPTGWITDNVPGADTLIFKTTDAHSGTYAVQGLATSLFSVGVPPTLNALFPWTARPTTFSGYYKYSPVGGDTLFIAVVFAKSSSPIAVAIFRTTTAAASYTQFSVPLQYLSSATPDSGAIDIAIVPGSGSTVVHVGSTFKVDDLLLSGATGVESAVGQTPESYALHQNYPNPFNPTTVINYDLLVGGNVSLKVYDLLGREVATLVDSRMEAGSHQVTFDASRLTSGIYFYRLQAGTFVASRKLALLK